MFEWFKYADEIVFVLAEKEDLASLWEKKNNNLFSRVKVKQAKIYLVKLM